MAWLLRILAAFPLPVLHFLGWWLYLVAFYVVRWRVALARGNLDAAFPEKSVEERRRILRDCYRNLAAALMEAIWGYGATGEALKRRVRIVNPDLVDRCRAENRSVILLAGHLCNWEWLLLAAGAHLSIPIDVVYKPLRLADVDAYVRDARRRFGANPIPHKSFLYEVMRRSHEARAYALLADQTPLKRTPKYWLRFLNRDTAFFLGPERIARFLDANVVYVSMWRVRRGYYDVQLEMIAQPPYGDDAGPEIAKAYARHLEASIRAAPADWLWIHNKWKYPKPADEDERASRRRRP
jgi:KDO2-lipid IV(A) lauroyltransferase